MHPKATQLLHVSAYLSHRFLKQNPLDHTMIIKHMYIILYTMYMLLKKSKNQLK